MKKKGPGQIIVTIINIILYVYLYYIEDTEAKNNLLVGYVCLYATYFRVCLLQDKANEKFLSSSVSERKVKNIVKQIRLMSNKSFIDVMLHFVSFLETGLRA